MHTHTHTHTCTHARARIPLTLDRQRQERAMFRKSLVDFMEADAAELFARVDKADPDEVTVKEMVAALNTTTLHPVSRSKLLPLLGIIDEDGSFALTCEAFTALVERMKRLKVAGKLVTIMAP